MPDVVLVGGLLTPMLRVTWLLQLMTAALLVARFAARLGFDSEWSGSVAEHSVCLGLLGTWLGLVVANWSDYSSAPWTVLYVGDFMPVGVVTSALTKGTRKLSISAQLVVT